jgi:molybdopterin molybdotransferase
MRLQVWHDLAGDLVGLVRPVADIETVSVRGAAGRVLAKPLHALIALPARTHAVMDGYALGSAPPGSYRLPEARPEPLGIGEAWPVLSGEEVPPGTVAVVLADRAVLTGPLLTMRDASRKDNIRRAGEEAAAGAEVLKTGILLDARHAALAAAVGGVDLSVRRKPRIAILALHGGPASLPHLTVFEALLSARPIDLTAAVSVRPAGLTGAMQQLAGRNDLVVVIAESLGGEQGILVNAIAEAGGLAHVRRAALKPAKPIIMGAVDGTPVIGLAGTAYATAVAAHLFLRPVLRQLMGLTADTLLLPAFADFDRPRETGRAEALPVLADRRGPHLLLRSAGRFGQLSALAAMDGFALVAAEAGDIRPGDPLLFHPLLMPLV